MSAEDAILARLEGAVADATWEQVGIPMVDLDAVDRLLEPHGYRVNRERGLGVVELEALADDAALRRLDP